MKKKILITLLITIVAIGNTSIIADEGDWWKWEDAAGNGPSTQNNSFSEEGSGGGDGGGGYSCTVSTNCYDGTSTVHGSVSCTGSSSCSRAYNEVTCDDITTTC